MKSFFIKYFQFFWLFSHFKQNSLKNWYEVFESFRRKLSSYIAKTNDYTQLWNTEIYIFFQGNLEFHFETVCLKDLLQKILRVHIVYFIFWFIKPKCWIDNINDRWSNKGIHSLQMKLNFSSHVLLVLISNSVNIYSHVSSRCK